MAISLTAAAEPLAWGDLPGFAADDHRAAFATFSRSCAALLDGKPAVRPAMPPPAALIAVCRRALADPPRDARSARAFFETNFRPVRAGPGTPGGGENGFLTGYYEPVVDGALAASDAFTTPLLARPDDLVTFAAAEAPLGPGLSAGRRSADGAWVPYPDRAAIEAGALAGRARPLVWVRDPVEAFMIQVQGSARVRLPDGRVRRLVYAGRNGHPYTSIGRILVTEEGQPADLGLAGVKAWVRAHGQAPGTAGAALLARNKSYIFFAVDPDESTDGPIGGAGLRLTAGRSLAVDRSLWPYGLPFWVDADLPGFPTRFRRLMVAQDTGSAIVGPARLDIFMGSGDDAGRRAGDIRHAGTVIVLMPVEGEPRP